MVGRSRPDQETESGSGVQQKMRCIHDLQQPRRQAVVFLSLVTILCPHLLGNKMIKTIFAVTGLSLALCTATFTRADIFAAV